MTQHQLAKSIVDDLGFKSNTKVRRIPAASTKILGKHADSEPFDNSFNYRSVIGKLNYYEKYTRPDIGYQAHQCARFVSLPKFEHGSALRWLGRYIFGTMDKGIIYKPDRRKGLEVFVDAGFSGNWNKDDTENPDRSRHGYVICYAGLPIIWESQLQS